MIQLKPEDILKFLSDIKVSNKNKIIESLIPNPKGMKLTNTLTSNPENQIQITRTFSIKPLI